MTPDPRYTVGDEARTAEASDPPGRLEEGRRGFDSRAEAGAEEAPLTARDRQTETTNQLARVLYVTLERIDPSDVVTHKDGDADWDALTASEQAVYRRCICAVLGEYHEIMR